MRSLTPSPAGRHGTPDLAASLLARAMEFVHLFVNFTRPIDRFEDAFPVGPVLSRFHNSTFSFEVT